MPRFRHLRCCGLVTVLTFFAVVSPGDAETFQPRVYQIDPAASYATGHASTHFYCGIIVPCSPGPQSDFGEDHAGWSVPLHGQINTSRSDESQATIIHTSSLSVSQNGIGVRYQGTGLNADLVEHPAAFAGYESGNGNTFFWLIPPLAGLLTSNNTAVLPFESFEASALGGEVRYSQTFYGFGSYSGEEPLQANGSAYFQLSVSELVETITIDFGLGSVAAQPSVPGYGDGFAFDGSVGGHIVSHANLPTPPASDADYNNNGIVDVLDYVIWRSTLGQTGDDQDADGIPNGIVDDNDYYFWRQNYGEHVANTSAAVPEPTTITIATTLAWAIFYQRRRGRLTNSVHAGIACRRVRLLRRIAVCPLFNALR